MNVRFKYDLLRNYKVMKRNANFRAFAGNYSRIELSLKLFFITDSALCFTRFCSISAFTFSNHTAFSSVFQV